jgi:hypothetical protein
MCTGVRAATIIRLQADRIDFYYDRFLIEADGHVHIETSDGFQVNGEAFSMDLKLNRFVVAGRVSMSTKDATVTGAAVADFLDFNRLYLIPITTEPDRWTFLNNDLNHPVKGRIMPGDVFYFPSITQHPSITSKSAVIEPKTFVRFTNAVTYVDKAPVSLPSYVVNFSPSTYFAQNSLSGATFDLTWNFAGNSNSLTAVHLRYDPQNHGPYLAFEQHFVGQHEYAIFSINPATRNGKYFNLMLGDQMGKRFQIQTFSQMYQYSTQLGFNQPQAETQYTYITATQAFNHSFMTANGSFTNYNMLSPAAYNTTFGKGGNVGTLNHPTQLQVTWTSFQNRFVKKLPLYFQTYEGMGFNHDSVGANSWLCGYEPCVYTRNVPGLQAYGAPCLPPEVTPPFLPYQCPVYTTIWNSLVGFNLSAQSIKFGNPYHAYSQYYFNATYTKQRQWNSVPHHINVTSANGSLSRQFSRQINAYVDYSILNTGDYYLQGGYQPCVPINNPYCPQSLTSFLGVATWHTTSLGFNWVPSPEFNFSLLYREHRDFPIPEPGVFPLPPTDVLGQFIYPTYLGQPPHDITPQVRVQLMPHLMLNLQSTYYFNFGGLKWAPSTVFQLLPQ